MRPIAAVTTPNLAELTGRLADLGAALEAARRRVRELEASADAADPEGVRAGLRDSERIYRALFEGTSIAVTLRNQDFRLLDCNAAALRLFGCASVDELRGVMPADLAPPLQPDGRDTVTVFRDMTKDLFQVGMMRGEWWVRRRTDGAIVPTDVWSTAIRLDDGRVVIQSLLDDISVRKEAERLLQRAAERDALVLAVARHFVSAPVAGAIGFALRSLVAFTRAASAAVAPRSPGPTYVEPSSGTWASALTPAERDAVLVGEVVDDPPRVLSLPLAASGATIGWLELQPSCDAGVSVEARGAAVLVAEIVSIGLAREEAERRRRATEARYRLFVEQSQDAIVGFDLDSKMIFASRSCERVFGYMPEELCAMDKPFRSIVAPESRDELAGVVAAIERRQFSDEAHVFAWRHKDGRTVYTESVLAPVFDDNGVLAGMQSIARDVTERLRAEVALEKAKEEAIAASLTKSAFLANMSHELRTPLNGVLGMVDLLAQTALDERQRRYVRVARSSANLLLSVINDILDFSKVEAGRLDLEEIEFVLSDVVEDVAAIFAPAAEEKGIELCCEAAGPDDLLLGAPARIRQVLVNLVANAIKFTRRGEVFVRAATQRSGPVSVVRVEVRDTGIGIPAHAHGKLFQPFSQVDASTTREYGGTGLGLAISRQIIERMGGQIGFSSEPGAGSCFWFSIQLKAAVPADGSSGLPDKRLAGVRVLAVDDNATNRELLDAHLAGAGMLCETAADGDAALAMLLSAKDQGRPYRIAILDRQMPGVDGHELARRVKADPRIRDTILVMIGSVVRPLDPLEQQQLGIERYGTKPIWRPALLRMLSTVLSDMPPEVPLAPAAMPRDGTTEAPLVLLVEDSPINAEVAGEILRAAGYAFDLVTDGIRAVEAVQRRPYDFVLMDCQLPELDGYDATRRIREIEASGKLGARSRLPIVALTASATQGDLERCLAAGMDDHIAKPVDARRLLGTIASRLGAGVGVRPARRSPRPDGPRVSNIEAALGRLQNNGALLDRIIVQFQGAGAEARADLRRAVGARDARQAAFIAHRLRGQAASFDADALVERIESLEDAARQEDWPLAAALLPSLDRELDRLLIELAASRER